MDLQQNISGTRIKQVCVQPSTAAVNVTLLAFAADSRAVVRRAAEAPLLLGAGRAAICMPGPQQQTRRATAAVDSWDRQTGGRTPYRYIDSAHTLRTMSMRIL